MNIAVACLLTAFAAGCADGEGRGPQRIEGWSVSDDDELILWVDTCDGDPETTLEESDAEVVITVVSTKRSSDDDCQEPVTVVLSQPLGDREVADGKTGDKAPSMEG
ncbi:hypothetical protein [Kineococcus sp. R86509]|uniref:hypothetical protein n=1 Tax=Kineococcus sp. R86509 TaxID=3093851 RepID=UPI0036D3310D